MNSIKSTPKHSKDAREWFEALLELARFLRSEKGCPWDREQTTASFAHYLSGEADELREAVDEDDNAHIEEEFGDTFFCALMTAVVAEDEGRFRLEDAFERAHAKMIRRHAHIFGDRTANTADEVVEVWKQVKAEENKQ